MPQNSNTENNKKNSNKNAPKIEQKKNDSLKPPTIVITDNTKTSSNKDITQMSSKSPNKKRSDLSKKALPQIVKKQNKNFLQIPGM